MRIPPNTLQNSKLKGRLSPMWGAPTFYLSYVQLSKLHIKLNQTLFILHITERQ